jgi:hypothetical protein
MRDRKDVEVDFGLGNPVGCFPTRSDQEKRDTVILEVLLDIREILICANDITNGDGSRIK